MLVFGSIWLLLISSCESWISLVIYFINQFLFCCSQLAPILASCLIIMCNRMVSMAAIGVLFIASVILSPDGEQLSHVIYLIGKHLPEGLQLLDEYAFPNVHINKLFHQFQQI